jgi:protocatechuate 3,4-dioxygenase beta subunit
VIAKAALALTNTATGVISRTTTNEAGFYIFAGVVPGRYRLTAEAPSMRNFEATLTVQVQQPAVIDPVLEIGETLTTVVVQDVTPMVTSSNPTLGHVLERNRIEQLPINGRFVSSLLQTLPGMEGDRAFGLRDGSSEYVLDGASISDRAE